MVTTKLFIEGGGDSNDLRTECRRAFRQLLEAAGLGGRMPRIVACGGRTQAYDDFCTSSSRASERPILLVDSEGPTSITQSPWTWLLARDGWARPTNAHDNQCHLMVQCMESWFLADKGELGKFYGQGFAPKSLPANPNVEVPSKKDVYDGLRNATRATRTKGTYGKSAHSFQILGRLDPVLVRKGSAWAERFFTDLDTLL